MGRLSALCCLLLLAVGAVAGDKPKLIFSINPGRAGSFFLSHVLNTSSDIHAEHEWQPNMSGWALRRASIFDMEYTKAQRCVYPGYVQTQLDSHPPGVGFADSSSMFVQTMCDCVIEAFSDTHDIRVVWQRRYLPAVYASYRRHRIFDFPNALSLLWSYTPHAPAESFSLTTPICDWEDCSPDELTIMFFLEHEARGLWFRRTYPQIPVVEVRLEEVATEQGARYMMDRLGLRYSPEELRAVVQKNQDKLPKLADALPRCENLLYARNLILTYIRRAERMGITDLPPLPHMTPVNDEACQALLTAPATDAELDAIETNWPDTRRGPPLVIASPHDGAVLTVPANGTLDVYIGTNTPFPHVRPPLTVERHWLLCSTVHPEGGARRTHFVDDSSMLREIAIEWEQGEPRRVQVEGVRPGRNQVALGICYYDLEDLEFNGEQRAGSIHPDRMRVLWEEVVDIYVVFA